MSATTTAKGEEEEDRSISRFLRRGEEIAKHEPTTSYYCKLRAVELAMEMHPRPIDLIQKLLGELEVRVVRGKQILAFGRRARKSSEQTSFVRSFACARLNPNSLSFSLVFDFYSWLPTYGTYSSYSKNYQKQKQKRTKKITSHPSIDFAKVKRFALSVYDRADQRDRRKMFTRELVDAFDASAAFLYCLESQIFTPYKEQGCDFNQDLRQRAEYAEWRAYDVAVALRSGRAPTEVADGFDDTDGGGEFLNAGVAGISLAAAAPPPPLDLPNDVPKPKDRPKCIAQEKKKDEENEDEGEDQQQHEQEVKQEKEEVVKQEKEEVVKQEEEEVVKQEEEDQDVKNLEIVGKKKKKKKKAAAKSGGKEDDKDNDNVVSSRIATEKVSSDEKTRETPMFNGVTSTRHGNTDWIKIESKKTSQKFWFNEKTKEKKWEEPT